MHDRFPIPEHKNKIVLTYHQSENPAKYRLKQRFLSRYREIVCTQPNHEENDVGYSHINILSPSNYTNMSLQQMDQLIKPELQRQDRIINLREKQSLSFHKLQMNLHSLEEKPTNYHCNIYSAEFLKRISNMHNRQIDLCKQQFQKRKGFPLLKPLEHAATLSREEITPLPFQRRSQSFY